MNRSTLLLLCLVLPLPLACEPPGPGAIPADDPYSELPRGGEGLDDGDADDAGPPDAGSAASSDGGRSDAAGDDAGPSSDAGADDGGACVPRTCGDVQVACGLIADGCGGLVSCGELGCLVSFVAGHEHTCLLNHDGAGARCWGENAEGQIGDGTTDDALIPTAVSALPAGLLSIDVGTRHTCAVVGAGAVYCWGENDLGKLGLPGTADVLSPTEVATLSGGVRQVSAGGFHTCALLGSGDVRCFGDDDFGTLGDGEGDSTGETPVTVAELEDVTRIDTGAFHTCALDDAGALSCWGLNLFGELGDGTFEDRDAPVPVTLPAAVVSFSAGGDVHEQVGGSYDITDHTCALLADSTVMCWGSNRKGQLGFDPDVSETSNVPVAIPGLDGAAIEISAGGQHTCALLKTGGVACWGFNGSGQLGNGESGGWLLEPTLVDGIDDAIGVTAGGRHTCALLADGSLHCWGDGDDGRLGVGEVTGVSPTPLLVEGGDAS